jgi:hypothetical protein
MGWTIGVVGFDSRRWLGIFLFTTASKTALGTPSLLSNRYHGILSLGANRPGREADHSPLSIAEVKVSGAIPPLPNTPSWRRAQLKHRDNFTFTLCFQFRTNDVYLQDSFLTTSFRKQLKTRLRTCQPQPALYFPEDKIETCPVWSN